MVRVLVGRIGREMGSVVWGVVGCLVMSVVECGGGWSGVMGVCGGAEWGVKWGVECGVEWTGVEWSGWWRGGVVWSAAGSDERRGVERWGGRSGAEGGDLHV